MTMPSKRDHGDGGIDQLGSSERWRIRWRIGGKRYSKVLRGSKQAAQRELRRLIHEEAQPDKGMTVGKYLRGWLDGDHDLAPKTRERYRQLLVHQVAPFLGNVPLQELRPAQVKTWLDTLLKSGSTTGGGLSPTTVGHARRFVHNGFERAVALEIISRNVVHPVKAPRGDTAEIDILSDERIGEIMTKLAGHPLYPIAMFALGTGCRRGEVCGLQWGDIDFTAATVTISRSMEQTGAGVRTKDPKTRTGRRTIPLAAHTIEVLRAHRAKQTELWLQLGLGRLGDDDLVFARDNGSVYKPDSLSVNWVRAMRALGLPPVTFHSLRHTFASAAISAGVNVVTVSRHLGHGSPAITLSVYAHIFKQDDRAAADAIEQVLRRGA
jgi:integrase